MNYLEIYDPSTGKKKRKELGKSQGGGNYLGIFDTLSGKSKIKPLPTQSDIQKNIQQIAPNPSRTQTLAYDARAHQMGKPRTQGFNGVNQGANGFIGALVKSTMPKIDSTLNDIKAQQQYKMPEFTTNNALSKEWFDTALKRIAVRNKMKMDMERMRALSRILPSLVSGASTATNAAVEANRAKLINQSKQSELSEQKRWHDIMGEYYRGLLSQKEQGEPDPYKIDKIKIERYKLLAKSPTSVIPFWDNLDEQNKVLAADYFVRTGQLPQVQEVKDGLFGQTYKVVIPQEQPIELKEPMQPSMDTHTTVQDNTVYGNFLGKPIKKAKQTSDGDTYVYIEDS